MTAPTGATGATGATGPVQPGEVDTTQAGSGAKPVIHGEKWSGDGEDGDGDPMKRGGKSSFKETWVYVDGIPKGALLYPEIPAELPVAWKDDVEGLDFKPGDTKKERKIKLLRYRLADYLRVVAGVDLKKIKMVYIHGKGVVAIPGDQFRKYANGITFDFTGNDFSKTRFYWPTDMKTNTAYDRYIAVSVFVEKPPMTLDEHNNPYIEGVEVGGIPYYGTPLRGGFRVYLDNKLVHVIKRNELGTVGRVETGNPDAPYRWDLGKILESKGVTAKPVAGDLVIARDLLTQKRLRLDEAYVTGMTFGDSSNSSGGLAIGKEDLSGSALLLYTAGHVPPNDPLPPLEKVAE